MTELLTSETKLEAKAGELIRDAIRATESASFDRPDPYALREAVKAETAVATFVLALIECAEALRDHLEDFDAAWRDRAESALAKLEAL